MEESLGQGGVGTVFATHAQGGQPVALKENDLDEVVSEIERLAG